MTNKNCHLFLIDLVDQIYVNSTNRCDGDRRKELYKNLSSYLDRRHVREPGQTYIFPVEFTELIRQEYPENVRNYTQIKTMKNGRLIVVKDEDKCHVKLSDFCKNF